MKPARSSPWPVDDVEGVAVIDAPVLRRQYGDVVRVPDRRELRARAQQPLVSGGEVPVARGIGDCRRGIAHVDTYDQHRRFRSGGDLLNGRGERSTLERALAPAQRVHEEQHDSAAPIRREADAPVVLVAKDELRRREAAPPSRSPGRRAPAASAAAPGRSAPSACCAARSPPRFRRSPPRRR